MACVATAPTPASAHNTPLPTENTFECTAAPISPVSGSNPRIENVPVGSVGPLTRGACGNCPDPATRDTDAMTTRRTARRIVRMVMFYHRLMKLRQLAASVVVLVSLAVTTSARQPAAIPAKISDADFWKLTETLSEPAGYFQSDNFVG